LKPRPTRGEELLLSAEEIALRIEHFQIISDSFPIPRSGNLDTRNNCDFGRLMIRAVFDEVSVGI